MIHGTLKKLFMSICHQTHISIFIPGQRLHNVCVRVYVCDSIQMLNVLRLHPVHIQISLFV